MLYDALATHSLGSSSVRVLGAGLMMPQAAELVPNARAQSAPGERGLVMAYQRVDLRVLGLLLLALLAGCGTAPDTPDQQALPTPAPATPTSAGQQGAAE